MLLLGANAQHDFCGRQVIGHRYGVLLPQVRAEWRAPSIALPKDGLGNDGSRTRFRLTARLNDGHVAWRGWFQDREDLDAFLLALFSGSLRVERELWRLPTPQWHPDINPFAVYDFATLIIKSTPTGSNQTSTSPSDWSNTSNAVETIGAGGSGAAIGGGADTGSLDALGAGGGAWNGLGNSNSLGANFTFASPGTTTYVWQAGTGGATKSSTTNTGVAGAAGGDSWFNSTTLAGSSCGSKGGSAGSLVSPAIHSGPAGGVAASGVGSGNNGGAGGGTNTTAVAGSCTGAGGAAGPTAAGTAGTTTTGSALTQTAGGQGEGTVGGAGTAAVTGTTATSTGGGNGVEMADAASGSGGGSGAARATGTGSTATSGAGGKYGAGSGAATNTGASGTRTAISGAGGGGLVALTYTPVVAGGKLFRTSALTGLGAGGPFFVDPIAGRWAEGRRGT